jgi:cbb3-type cytochrome oxidase subunit 3
MSAGLLIVFVELAVYRSQAEQSALFVLVMLMLFGGAQWFMPRPARRGAR